MLEPQWEYDDEGLDWEPDDYQPGTRPTYASAIESLREAASSRNDVTVEWDGQRGRRGDARVVFGSGASRHRVRLRHGHQLVTMLRVINSANLISDRQALWFRQEHEIVAWLRADYRQVTTALGRQISHARRDPSKIDQALADDVEELLSHQGLLEVTASEDAEPQRNMRLGLVTDELKLIYGGGRLDAYGIALRMKNFTANSSDEARDLLEQYASGYLYDVMRHLDIAVRLWTNSYPTVARPVSQGRSKVRFPHRAHDLTAFELYAAANVTERDTLERFLKYYQVLEYYFPRAVGKYLVEHHIENINKHKLSSGAGLSSERGALEVTVEYAMGPAQLSGFMKGTGIFRALSDSTLIESVSLLDTNGYFDPSIDYRAPLASRIYDIRCRIVHAKEPNQTTKHSNPPLLPRSREARDLGADLALVKFAAERSLLRWSTPLA